ncbi:uncharacterized protein J4E84_011061 [Alternaria hordeiaustralica]|uniref:uncharacterized protein n=1 Tax=Alternaria hordeiaustralica TaxID=1187925 RepID=UPI0020C2F20B|nr:uncharacterized protein J4E84_011061 [Alternaria hordeiaustralica]KAI4673478.1 hypothetical protein J4E84_011061 [Alternaria hordeiaustralica]
MQATDTTKMADGASTIDETAQVPERPEPRLEEPKEHFENASANDDTTDQTHTRDPEKTTPPPVSSPNTVVDPEHPDKEKSTAEVIAKEKTADDTTPEDTTPSSESQYLSGPKLAILTLGLCLTTFVIALDNTIIATAIPRITTVFNSLEDVGWYGSSYLLTTTSLQPSFGKVYTYFDVKYTYLSALILFEVGSVICAAATSSAMFIVGRAVAGAGAAALYSGGMTIIGFSVPLRKRAIYIAALSSMFGIASVVGPILGGALTDRASWRCHIFYLPFYFQAIKGTSAEESGIRTIAYLVSITVSSIVIGGLITLVGWYAPFMWFGSAIFAIGAGMLYTLTVHSPPGQWIGYQILAGIGAGAGVQIPFVAVQVVTNETDMPTANACVMFFNSLGGALSISVAQNIFVNTLAKEVPRYAPGFDARIVANAGATNLRNVVPEDLLPGVLLGYNNAIVTAFILAIATSSVAFFVSLGMEQKSVKGKKIMAGGAA